METLHDTERKQLPGSTILRLVTVQDHTGEVPGDTGLSKAALMEDFVFGDGLANVDRLIIDGADARSFLPRPDAYGNNRLALMAVLDTLPAAATMNAQMDEVTSAVAAAD